MSQVFFKSCLASSGPPSPTAMVPKAPYRVWESEPKIMAPHFAICSRP